LQGAEAAPAYTVVGSGMKAASTGVTAVLLNREGRYPRRTVFQELEKVGFDQVISMEGNREHYDIEELAGRFPFVRFILPAENSGGEEAVTALNMGELLNIAAWETESPLFLAIWNDLSFVNTVSAARIAERMMENGKPKRLCTVPVIQNSRYEALPTYISPVVDKGMVTTIFWSSEKEGMPSLFPFDGIGVYDRERFLDMGGYDVSLKSRHWQLMDFGFRSRLWGEDISGTQVLRLTYSGDSPVNDTTVEASYRQFFLRNIAPVFRGESANLPLRKFIPFWTQSGLDPFAALSLFRQSRGWVRENRFRFKTDTRSLLERWPVPEM
jgi:hypothetical protein